MNVLEKIAQRYLKPAWGGATDDRVQIALNVKKIQSMISLEAGKKKI